MPSTPCRQQGIAPQRGGGPVESGDEPYAEPDRDGHRDRVYHVVAARGREATCRAVRACEQPLYLDRGDNDPERVVTAPHLVVLDERDTLGAGRGPDAVIPALLDLFETPSAGVFWRCEAGARALYRHLRGLNMVLIPRAEVPPGTKDTHEAVLFRHADANVMTRMAPAMTANEAAQLGVTSEVATGKWCDMQFMTAGRMMEQPHLQDFLPGAEVHPNEAVTVILREMIRITREHGA